MSICKIPSIIELRAAAAATPASSTRSQWYREVANSLGIKPATVSRLCIEHQIAVPERVGARTYFKGK